jgi:uncharacterized protein (DUF1330 family)
LVVYPGEETMAADLVLIQQVHDIDRYRNEYLPGLRLFLRKHGAEVLVAGFNAEPVEGEPPNSTVVPWWHVDSLAAIPFQYPRHS